MIYLMNNILIIIIILLFIGIINISITLTNNQMLSICDTKNEKEATLCLEPMLGFANAIQERQNLAQNINYQKNFLLPEGTQIFRELCSLYSEFKKCTSNINCESISIKAVEASYGFMCGIGNEQFKEHADCFSRLENKADYIYCKSIASNEINKEKENNKNKLCYTMNNYLKCCKPLVERNCGNKAWKLVAKITKDSLNVSLPDCNLFALEN
ncbi:DUF19 domain-containing protein [Meloidogyne graminicola]|uniref:DUF19 domain-containing protein n=1 Tax=Meloidogyne graminicola TaxID=189291 RepID=A0A8S9ZX50_9BILA|nr:DUF19 domain-containing protein [Meloidogyne graminicola]